MHPQFSNVPGFLYQLTTRLSQAWSDNVAALYTALINRAAYLDKLAIPGNVASAVTLADVQTTVNGLLPRRKPTSIKNACSDGGVLVSIPTILDFAKVYTPANHAANALVTVINETGAGSVQGLGVGGWSGGGQLLRIKVTVDGSVVFDATSSSNPGNTTGLVAVYPAQAFDYHTSLKVEATTSIANTGTQYRVYGAYTTKVAA